VEEGTLFDEGKREAMSRRLVLALVAAIALGPSADGRAGSTRGVGTSADLHLLRQASLLLGRHKREIVLSWLRHQAHVSGAELGPDGRTLEIAFRDGLRTVIFAATGPASVARSIDRVSARRLPATRAADGRRRALVLEPFATELGLGPHSGDLISQTLADTGFEVDAAYDGAVTVLSMEDLWHYDVVYMDTHSGVNQYGEGVVGTGQLADGDPAVEQLVKEGSVLIGGVAGSSQLYYGILSGFVMLHEQQFPAGALLFVNGCTLLKGTAFWYALAARGAGAMISWSDDVAPVPAAVAGNLVVADLASHFSVADTVAQAPRQGYAFTNAEGGPAHLGYLGDGSLTLWPEAAATPTPSPIAASGETPVGPLALSPTVTPTASPTPTPMATSRPRPLGAYGRPPSGCAKTIDCGRQYDRRG
jgi:hypothetical protein